MSQDAWQEWSLNTAASLVESLEDWLFEQGALAVTLEDDADQPLLEPGPGETPIWDAVKVTALFAADVNLAPIVASVPREALTQDATDEIKGLADKDWERVWMDDFRPMQLGERLWVCPSWTDVPDPNAVNVLLDPGLAFGTGTHATTAMCLSALDALIVGGEAVADYGCGSGILAIAALKLGAATALGIDNDPQALVASRDNAERNVIRDEQLLLGLPDCPDEQAWSAKADVVVANILAEPLIQLSDRLLALMALGGTVLMTGVLIEQAPRLIDHYARVDVTLTLHDQRDGWALLRGVYQP
ncbi:MAG: 50S ribosomal protein L11 methyltransferase [Luminiphilus sp.]|nr:50S ribosomal protein L11 methyltransferase [Luminiphilus sp.]